MTIEATAPETDDPDFHELLSKRRQIAIIWSTEDVHQERPDLTDDQAWEVLQQVESCHDCNYGITWDTLTCVANYLFPRPESGRE